MDRRSWTARKDLTDRGEFKYSFTYETYNEEEFNIIEEKVTSFLRAAKYVDKIEHKDYATWLHYSKPSCLEDSPDEIFQCSHCHTDCGWYTPFCPVCGKMMMLKYRFRWTDGERVMAQDTVIPVHYTSSQEELELWFKKIMGFDYDSKSCSIELSWTGGEIE